MFIYLQAILLKDFQTFENKNAAISLHNGVSNQLGRMIKKWLRPGQKLAVGKLEYKTVIEASLVSVIFLCLLAYVNHLSNNLAIYFFREYTACLMKL